jgi:UDP-N-acetylmuramoyl-tripeptide--D-alanyl-D-alanine ligase
VIPLNLTELANVLDCPAPSRDVEIKHILTDSRKVVSETLFAALTGEHFDGHDFAADAVRLGASALLVERELEADAPQLIVDDVLRALGAIAGLLRDRLDPKVVGITGSNGKTTVKEMVASILALEGDVLATQGNYNNELGLPLTLFELEQKHRYAVLEMGASKSGDIAYLAAIGKPDVGLVNNIAPAHLEGFGSIEGVARTKGEMFAALPAGGCAVMNADEPWLDLWRSMNTAGATLTFGSSAGCDVRLEESAEGARLQTPAGALELKLALPGRHNLINAAAATATALAMDVSMDTIRQGLERVQPVPGRLNLLHTAAGWTVIDDTYNANPASLYSALQVLSQIPGESWLVLGDMKELGSDSSKMHREVGENARVLGIKRLFATGEMSEHTVDMFGRGAVHFETREDLIRALRRQVRPGVNLLVKGSRSMQMESVVEAIVQESELREAS